jgi:hypothetical protein
MALDAFMRQISEMRKTPFPRQPRTNSTVPALQFKFLFAFRRAERLLLRRTGGAVTFGYLGKRGSQIHTLQQTKTGIAEKPFVIAIRTDSVVPKRRTGGNFRVRYWTSENLACEN